MQTIIEVKLEPTATQTITLPAGATIPDVTWAGDGVGAILYCAGETTQPPVDHTVYLLQAGEDFAALMGHERGVVAIGAFVVPDMALVHVFLTGFEESDPDIPRIEVRVKPVPVVA